MSDEVTEPTAADASADALVAAALVQDQEALDAEIDADAAIEVEGADAEAAEELAGEDLEVCYVDEDGEEYVEPVETEKPWDGIINGESYADRIKRFGA